MHEAFTSEILNYWLYRPEDRPTTGLPLLIFLHGSGERGQDLALVKKYGIPNLLDGKLDFPAVVLSPQCPAETRWYDHADAVISLIKQIMIQHPIDRNRVLLTGFSMGGQGVWYIGALYPEVFAALAPVSGRIPPQDDFEKTICVLRDMPMWVQHGTADEIVPYSDSEKAVTWLRACGGHPHFTSVIGATHTQTPEHAYTEALYEWLFAQQRH
ncbi:MAG: prolyl oligopeptidase family serine peptidase [Anaerolineae bacterium]